MFGSRDKPEETMPAPKGTHDTVVGAGCRIKGDLDVRGSVLIRGTVEGAVHATEDRIAELLPVAEERIVAEAVVRRVHTRIEIFVADVDRAAHAVAAIERAAAATSAVLTDLPDGAVEAVVARLVLVGGLRNAGIERVVTHADEALIVQVSVTTPVLLIVNV